MKFKKFFSLILSLFVIASVSFSSSAAKSSVKYVGGAEEFVFFPESTDLFQNFKDVMPGDSLKQKVTISNKSKDKRIQIYFKAETTDEKYVDFLRHVNIKVIQDDKILLSDSLASKQGGPTRTVLLGTFEPNELTELTVILDVDIEMDNKYQDDYGEIVWLFAVEKEDVYNPQMGDNNIPIICASITLGISLVIVLFIRKKRYAEITKQLKYLS